MSTYGPSGGSGPYPEPPGDSRDRGYDQPTRPTQPTLGPTGYSELTDPEVPAWASPPPPRPKRPTGLVLAVVSVVVVLLCGVATAGLYLLRRSDGPRPGSAAAVGTPTAQPTASPSAPSPSATTPSVNPTDVRTFTDGQCVVNEGSEDDPNLRTVACGPNTLKIIARFGGTSDVRKCDSVTGATHHYYYKTTPESLSFVLCFRRQ